MRTKLSFGPRESLAGSQKFRGYMQSNEKRQPLNTQALNLETMKISHETDACAQQRSRTRDDRWTKTPQKIADGKPRWELSTKNCSMMKCMDQNNTTI